MPIIPFALGATLLGLMLTTFMVVPLPLSGVLSLVALVAAFFFRKQGAFSFLLFCLALFFLIQLHYFERMAPSAAGRLIDQLTGKVELQAEIEQVRQLADGRTDMRVRLYQLNDKEQPVALEPSPRLRLYVEQGSDRFLPGDRIGWRGKLRRPRLFGTPGEFNYPRHLASEGITATAWLKSDEALTLLSAGQRSVARIIAGWRRQLGAAVSGALAEQQACLTRALLLGESRLLPATVRERLAASGVSHLFAISGLHLGLIAVFAYRLLAFFYLRSERLTRWQPPLLVLPLIVVPLLSLYLLLTGDGLATRRALVLAFLAAVFLWRRYFVNPLMLLATLALLSLWFNPLLLWRAGWQLSFAGAAGILLWRPLWQHARLQQQRFWTAYPQQLLLVSLAATLATLPLVLFNFHQLAPLGVLANLFCVPLVSFLVLPVGLAGLLCYPLFPPLSLLCFQWVGWLLDGLYQLLGWLLELPVFAASSLFFSRWQMLALSLLILALLLLPLLSPAMKVRLLAGCALLAALFWSLPALLKQPSALSVTLFSVGQGESILLQNSQGQALLVDGGGLYSERFDVGERLLAPALAELGVRRLDAVLLTHDHPDHRKGLLYLLEHFPVASFYTNKPLAELPPALGELLVKRNLSPIVPPPGWSQLAFWQSGALHVHASANLDFEENDRSLALYLGAEGSRQALLLTGDLESGGVRELLSSALPGAVTLLKLPHHGSKYSLIDQLVAQTKPQLCLVSAGYRNRYRLPAAAVVRALEQQRIPLLRTDLSGTIRVRQSAQGWQAEYWKQGRFRQFSLTEIP